MLLVLGAAAGRSTRIKLLITGCGRGCVFELGFLLALVVVATACARHDEVVAHAQWAVDAPEWVLTALGAKPDPLTGAITTPSESTLCLALAGVGAADLQ